MSKEKYRFQFNKNIIVTLSDERLITPSGLCMVGQIFGKSSLAKKAARMTTDKRSQPQIKNGDILLSEIGMLTLGKTSFDYINEFHSDPEYYKAALDIAYGIPSESTLRMRLDTIGQSMDSDILEGNVSMFKACKVEPSAMTNGYVPVDLDVTPFDNSKTHKEAMKKNDMPVRHKTIKRRRIRTVIDRLILIAGHLTVHARKMKLSLGRSNPWANAFIRIYNALATI